MKDETLEEYLEKHNLMVGELKKIQADAIRWLAQEHWDECREDRPIQNWMQLVADRIEDGFFKVELRKENE